MTLAVKSTRQFGGCFCARQYRENASCLLSSSCLLPLVELLPLAGLAWLGGRALASCLLSSSCRLSAWLGGRALAGLYSGHRAGGPAENRQHHFPDGPTSAWTTTTAGRGARKKNTGRQAGRLWKKIKFLNYAHIRGYGRQVEFSLRFPLQYGR